MMGVYSRKFLKMLICLTTAFGIAACSSGNKNNSNNASDKNSSEKKSIGKSTQSITATEFTTDYKIEYAKDGYFTASKLDGKLMGLLNFQGKTVIPFEYDYVSFPVSKNAKAVIVSKEGKEGILDYNGKEILPIEYNDIHCDYVNGFRYGEKYGENKTRYLVTKDGIQSIVNLQGKTEKTLKGKYDALTADALLANMDAGPEGFLQVYTLDEKEITTPSHNFAKETGINGIVEFTGQYNTSSDEDTTISYLVDKNGNYQEIKCIDRDGGDLNYLGNENLLSVECSKGEIYSVDYYCRRLVNVKDKSVSKTKYIDIIGNESGAYGLYQDSSKNYIVDIYNTGGEITKKLTYDNDTVNDVRFAGPWIKVSAGDTKRLYNKEGKQPSDQRYLDVYPIKRTNLLLLENIDGKFGIMDSSGDMLAEFGKIDEGLKDDLENESCKVYEFENSACIVEKKSSGSHVTLYTK